MHLSARLQKAINFASSKHAGQLRKADLIPYISHPFSVAWILSAYEADEDTVIGGLLHDVLEDVPDCSENEIESIFGERVLNMVKEVSEDKTLNAGRDRKSSWRERKQAYLDHLMNASQEAMMICAADKIHNLSSHVQTFFVQGEKMWKNFSASPASMLSYYEEVLKILRDRLLHPIVEELARQVEDFKKLLGNV